MADDVILRHAIGQIERARDALARDAQYLADDAARFAAGIIKGGLYAGDTNRLAQAALQLAVQAARVDALSETIAYLKASE